MEKYYIRLEGCHDSTYFEMELTEKEVKLIERLSIESHAQSSCECMPTLSFWKVDLNED